MANWFSTRMPTSFNGERIFFSTNGAITGYPHVKKWNWTPTTHCVQKLIQNGSDLNLRAEN